MRTVYIASDNIITSLGFTTGENIQKIRQSTTGVKLSNDPKLAPAPFYVSLVDSNNLLKL